MSDEDDPSRAVSELRSSPNEMTGVAAWHDLAIRLQGVGATDPLNQHALLLDRAPTAVAPLIPLPVGAQILGSLIERSGQNITVVVEAPGTEETIRAWYEDRLRGAGWSPLGGASPWWSVDPRGPLLSLDSEPLEPERAGMHLRFMFAYNQTPDGRRRQGLQSEWRDIVEHLPPPLDGYYLASGILGFGRSSPKTCRLETRDDRARVCAHYEAALSARGWTRLASGAAGALGWSCWRIDDPGCTMPWFALLGVVHFPWAPRWYDLRLEIVDPLQDQQPAWLDAHHIPPWRGEHWWADVTAEAGNSGEPATLIRLMHRLHAGVDDEFSLTLGAMPAPLTQVAPSPAGGQPLGGMTLRGRTVLETTGLFVVPSSPAAALDAYAEQVVQAGWQIYPAWPTDPPHRSAHAAFRHPAHAGLLVCRARREQAGGSELALGYQEGAKSRSDWVPEPAHNLNAESGGALPTLRPPAGVEHSTPLTDYGVPREHMTMESHTRLTAPALLAQYHGQLVEAGWALVQAESDGAVHWSEWISLGSNGRAERGRFLLIDPPYARGQYRVHLQIERSIYQNGSFGVVSLGLRALP